MNEHAGTTTTASQGPLRRDALGLLGSVSLTAAYMAPAASLIALFGPIAQNAGSAAGFVMLLGLVLTLPSAISFGILARELPSAGGVYAWGRQTFGERVGIWIGLTTAGYYLLTVLFPPIVFGQLFNALIEQAGGHASIHTWLAGVLISLAIAGISTYRGIAASSVLAFAMLVLQLVVMTALVMTALVAAGARGVWAEGLGPAAGPSGWSGVVLALPLVLLSLACDAATPASEETRDARRTIPLAVIMTLLLVGGWDVVAFGVLAGTMPAADLASLCTTGADSVLPEIARRLWGSASLLVTLVGMAAMIGALVPCSTAASRLVYSLAREGVLPCRLAATHARYVTPWPALHLVFVLTLLAIVPPAFALGTTATIAWWGNIVGWFITVVYFTVNACNIVYFRRLGRARFSYLWNGLVPALAMTAQGWVVWRVLIRELWAAGWSGRSAQAFILLATIATGVYALRAARPRAGAMPGERAVTASAPALAGTADDSNSQQSGEEGS